MKNKDTNNNETHVAVWVSLFLLFKTQNCMEEFIIREKSLSIFRARFWD